MSCGGWQIDNWRIWRDRPEGWDDTLVHNAIYVYIFIYTHYKLVYLYIIRKNYKFIHLHTYMIIYSIHGYIFICMYIYIYCIYILYTYSQMHMTNFDIVGTPNKMISTFRQSCLWMHGIRRRDGGDGGWQCPPSSGVDFEWWNVWNMWFELELRMRKSCEMP